MQTEKQSKQKNVLPMSDKINKKGGYVCGISQINKFIIKAKRILDKLGLLVIISI